MIDIPEYGNYNCLKIGVNMEKGFTLVEALLALAIVGLLAAFTIPKLVTNFSYRVYVSTLQSIHDNLSTVTNSVFTQEKVGSLADSSLGSSAQAFMRRYFEVIKECNSNHSDCLAGSYKSLNKTNSISTTNMLNNNFYCAMVHSGAVICLTTMDSDSDSSHGKSVFVVDVNGKDMPNINGRDLFSFELYSDGKIGNQYNTSSNDADGVTCANYASTAGYGGACYSKIVADGWKMNY